MNEAQKHLDTFRKLDAGQTVSSDEVAAAEMWSLKRRVKSLEERIEVLLDVIDNIRYPNR
jgi:hypothetical protein